MDGNRTRRTGIARPTRFEGGGAHQVPRHLPVDDQTVRDEVKRCVGGPAENPTQTESKSRAPVSLDGCRNLDIARASI